MYTVSKAITLFLLLCFQTNVLAKDHTEGKTCLHWAAGQPSLSSSSIIQLLCKKRRQLIEETDQYGRTPLHLAAMCGNVEGIKALKAAGCNLNAIDIHEEYTALHWAAGCCDVEMMCLYYIIVEYHYSWWSS